MSQIIPQRAQPLRATHQGTLKIADKVINCAVLEDGTRVIAQSAMFRAFDRPQRGRAGALRAPNMPSFIDANNLQPFIDEDLRRELTSFEYINKHGRLAKGFRAEILPEICEVYLNARDQNVLLPQQKPLAIASEILVRGLARVGIIALVDEATGYQADRQKDELQKILAAYISKELLPWQRRFPAEYYQQICRLRNWNYDPFSNKRPRIIGWITNQIVYELLPEGVLDELRRLNPPNERGYRPYKHHQYLTEDIGNPHLERHLVQVITAMRLSKDWADFEDKLAELFDRYPHQPRLPFTYEDEQERASEVKGSLVRPALPPAQAEHRTA
jgi:hypothetical protein